MYFARAVYIMWLRDLLRFRRNRARIIGSLAQPLLWLVIFGTGLSPALRFGTADASPLGGNLNYMQFLFPGIVGMTVLFTAIFSAVSVAWDREFGFLKEILVAPVPRSAVAIGKALGGSTVAVLQGTLMLIFAPFLGVTLSPTIVAKLIGVMFLLSFSLTALGILFATVIKTMEGFQVVMQFLLMPMFMLSGAVFPLQNLPTWMDVLVKVNPVTYGIDPLRQIALADEVPGAVAEALSLHPIALDLAVLVAFGSVMTLFAVYAFNRHL